MSSKVLSVISFSLLALGVVGFSGCSSDAETGNTNPEPTESGIKFTATVTDTTTTRSPNAAYQYVTFDIKSDVEVNVKLVLKEKGQPAPTRKEVLDGAGIYRALKTKNKSLLLMYDIDSKIKTYREAVQASGRGVNVLHDATATALTVNATGDGDNKVDAQNVNALLLKQNTTYTLYALQSDGPGTEEVQTLIDLTTREFDSTNLPAAGANPIPDLGVPAPNIPYDAASEKGIESTHTDLILYDSRDAALIIPFTAANIQNLQIITWANIQFTKLNDVISRESLFTMLEGLGGSEDVYTLLKDEIIISLLVPSFSTDGTKYYKTYNNVKYQYGYVLIHDYSDIYNGCLFEQTQTYANTTVQAGNTFQYAYELQQDQ